MIFSLRDLHFFSPTLRKFLDAQQLDSIKEISPLGRFHWLRINSQPLFIEFENVCFWRTFISIQDYGFLSWKRKEKEKASPLEFQRSLIVSSTWKNIEVYETRCHEEEETFQDVNENEHFSPFYCYEKGQWQKENSIFKFSTCVIRWQRILTY